MKSAIALCAAVLLLAACAALDRTPEQVRGSRDYQEGWRDGCVSGLYLRNVRLGGAPQAGDRFVHNAERWRDSSEYVVGWGDGLKSCDVGRPGTRN